MSLVKFELKFNFTTNTFIEPFSFFLILEIKKS
jgi:hypothetical protein